MSCPHVLGRLMPGGCPLCSGAVYAAPEVAPRPPQTRVLSSGYAIDAVELDGAALLADAIESGDVERARDLLRELDRDACLGSLSEFVRLAFAVVQPGVELEWGPHIQAICDHVQWQLEDRDAVVRDVGRRLKLKCRNLLINVPPRSLKTIILTLATVWAWLRWPSLRIMYLSANPRVASTSARMARDLIRSPWFVSMFAPRWGAQEIDGATGDPITAEEWERRNPTEPEAWEIRGDQDALSDLGNTAGGARISRGLASQITGEGCQWLCVAKGTLVATEIGDVAIEALVEMTPQPRVWSMRQDGELELRNITGSHRTPDRETVRVRTDYGHVLRCTDDHRIWTDRGYREAARLSSPDNAGCELSVLWRAVDAPQGEADPVPGLRGRDADVQRVLTDLPTRGRGARQGNALEHGRHVLLAEVPGRGAQAEGVDTGMCGVRDAVRSTLVENDPRTLLESVRSASPRSCSATADGHRVPVLPDGVSPDQQACEVLHDVVQECAPQQEHAGRRQLELQRTQQPAQRRAVGEPGAVDPRARRSSVHGVRRGGGVEQGAERAPHRSRPDTQHAGEPDHAVLGGPHDAPQITRATVLSVDEAVACGRRETIDVYDINVEGNHNFFANGILVHNCIDDPHDTRDGAEKVAKAVEDYESAVHNRLNDPRTSIRIMIMQRVRPNDLAAKWLENGDVVHLRLPMEFESIDGGKVECKCGTCSGTNVFGFRDWRTAEGEVLHPRFTPEFLAGERKRLMSRYVGQHQQRPLESGGQIFKVGWWSWWSLTDSVPKARPTGARSGPSHVIARRRDGSLDLDFLDISVDCTGGSTRKTASNLGIGISAGKGERRFIKDLTEGPATWLQTMDRLASAVRLAGKWAGKQPKFTILIEVKALGQAAIEQLEAHLLAGDLRYPDGTPIRARVEPYEPTGKGDKDSRIELMEPDIAAGIVHLEDGEHVDSEFRDEVEGFPKALKKDRCDWLAQALDHRRAGEAEWVRLFKRKRAEAQARVAAIAEAQRTAAAPV